MTWKQLGSDNETLPIVIAEFIGLIIKEASIDDGDILNIKFCDYNYCLLITDVGQNCCEQRYMKCDDDINSIVGGKLLSIGIKGGPQIDDCSDCHEVQFLEISTDKSFITISNHNVHNGYYGGFDLAAKKDELSCS